MKKKHELGVSRLVTSHFHLKIAERIGDTDGIKALDRNGKALKKDKCIWWVVNVSRDSMAQCRNEVRTDLANRTERLKGDGEEMMIACNFNIFLFSAAEAAQADDILR